MIFEPSVASRLRLRIRQRLASSEMATRSRRPSAETERERYAGQVMEVLDASAILALLLGEVGADEAAEAVARGAVVSTVNLSEAADVLLRNNLHAASVIRRLSEQVTVDPFTYDDALDAAALAPSTRRQGLSLGDRGCLALARRLGATVLTADRQWTRLDLGVSIRLLR